MDSVNTQTEMSNLDPTAALLSRHCPRSKCMARLWSETQDRMAKCLKCGAALWLPPIPPADEAA